MCSNIFTRKPLKPSHVLVLVTCCVSGPHWSHGTQGPSLGVYRSYGKSCLNQLKDRCNNIVSELEDRGKGLDRVTKAPELRGYTHYTKPKMSEQQHQKAKTKESKYNNNEQSNVVDTINRATCTAYINTSLQLSDHI